MQLETLLECGVYSVLLVIFDCVIHIDRVCSALYVENRCSARTLFSVVSGGIRIEGAYLSKKFENTSASNVALMITSLSSRI